MTNRFYVYCYKDPSRSNERIYIGKGKGKRFKQHLSRKDKHPFTQRLQKMASENVEPIIEFLCRDVDEEFSLFVEQEAISLYGRKDLKKGSLLNLTDGGEGTSGRVQSEESKKKRSVARLGRTMSEESRKKLSNSRKGKFTGRIPANKGVPCTEETRKKISEAKVGRRYGLGNTGKKSSEETKNKISIANTGRVFKKEVCPHCRVEISINTIKRWHLDNCKTKPKDAT